MESQFPVILLAGLTVFGLAFIASQDQDAFSIGFGDGEEMQEAVFLEKDLGKIGSAKTDFRTINFRNFNIGETRGNILADREERADLKNSLLSGNRYVVEYNATQPRSGSINFEVLGRDGNGAVFVKVNGNRIWKNKLVSTGTPNVTIPGDQLKPGMNKIIVGTTQGGFLASTHYAIEDVEVTVNDRKFHDFTDTFQVYNYELQDLVETQLNFRITDSVKTQPLEIFINGEKIYSDRQVTTAEKVTVTPKSADLHPGLNTIKFETDGEALYELRNTDLTIRYIGNTRKRTVRLEFQGDRRALNFAERDNTEERLSFDYQRLVPSSRMMIIDLNGERHRFTPENGENTVDISSENLKEDNVMIIRSNATYQLNNLQLVSEKVE